MDTTATLHESELQQTALLFQALGDETRLRIVLMLARRELCVCELQNVVGAYQSRLSFHLKRLKDAGVVTDRKVGRWVYYTLLPEALAAMRGFLQGMEDEVASWPSGAEGCCG